jgi:hypothetical protein
MALMAALGLAQQLLGLEFFMLVVAVLVVLKDKHRLEFPDLVVLAVAMVAEPLMVLLFTRNPDLPLLQIQVLEEEVAALIYQTAPLVVFLVVMAALVLLFFAIPKSTPLQL